MAAIKFQKNTLIAILLFEWKIFILTFDPKKMILMQIFWKKQHSIRFKFVIICNGNKIGNKLNNLLTVVVITNALFTVSWCRHFCFSFPFVGAKKFLVNLEI